MTLLRADDEVHVWHIDLAPRDVASDVAGDGAGDVASAAHLVVLSHDERTRAGKFVAERDRRRFVAAHAALRRILSMYTGADASSIVFNIGEYGKPTLAAGSGNEIRFNLSHSGDVAVCAVTNACDVGVDVEEIRADVSVMRIAMQFFSAAEQQLLDGVSAERRAETFTRIWVSKEAYLKATGRGIGTDLSGFSVTLSDHDESVATVDDGVVAWAIRGLPVPSGFCAAVATPVPLPLSLRRFGGSA